MRNNEASRGGSVTIAVDVAHDLKALLQKASKKRQLNGHQRALCKLYAGVLKARLNEAPRSQIRVTRRWCLVVLRCLACLLEHSQVLRCTAERVMGRVN